MDRKSLLAAAVLLLFAVFCFARHRHVPGDDLSASYIGCRLLADGQPAHLYSHDPVFFTDVRDPLWNRVAQQSGFAASTFLHPYVQTPIWAWALRPLCTHTGYRPFSQLFLLLLTLSAAGTLWLVARFWTPSLLHPGWIALVCIGLYLTQPFRYALFLVQTHMLFVFLTVLALLLARAQKNTAAGLALALAAAVKITPGFLVLYWLVTRQYKAALSFMLWCAAIIGFSYGVLGAPLMSAFLHSLGESSNTLLVAFNNQSLAATIMGNVYNGANRYDLFHWRILPLPAALKALSMLLVLASSAVGGLFDRHAATDRTAIPYGAILAMVGATLFTPIAWDHYYILLVIPAMFLLDAWRRTRALHWLALAAGILLLNVYPISYNAVRDAHSRLSLVRSQFYSGLLCLVALYLLHRWQRHTPAPDLTTTNSNAPAL